MGRRGLTWLRDFLMMELALKISNHGTHQGSTHPEDSPVCREMNVAQA